MKCAQEEVAAPPALAGVGAGDESRGQQYHTLPLLLWDKAAIFPGSGNTGESLSLQETLGWGLANRATRGQLGRPPGQPDWRPQGTGDVPGPEPEPWDEADLVTTESLLKI